MPDPVTAATPPPRPGPPGRAASTTPPASAAALAAFGRRVAAATSARCRSSSGWSSSGRSSSPQPGLPVGRQPGQPAVRCATVGVISLGIVCVLMVGPDRPVRGLGQRLPRPSWACCGSTRAGRSRSACVVASPRLRSIGVLYALLFNRLGMPSFVATLAGLLAFLGLQLYVLGAAGSINLPLRSAMVDFGAAGFMPPVRSVRAAPLPGARDARRRLRTARAARGRSVGAVARRLIAARAARSLVGLEVVVWYLDQRPRRAVMFGFFAGAGRGAWTTLLTRTRWGRSMSAVGGNREAARRAGINVRAHLHQRVRAVLERSPRSAACWRPRGWRRPASQRHRRRQPERHRGRGHRRHQPVRRPRQRLFGAAGRHRHPVDLQRPDAAEPHSSLRFMITGAVLAIAVIVDSLARRSRASHGAG